MRWFQAATARENFIWIELSLGRGAPGRLAGGEKSSTANLGYVDFHRPPGARLPVDLFIPPTLHPPRHLAPISADNGERGETDRRGKMDHSRDTGFAEDSPETIGVRQFVSKYLREIGNARNENDKSKMKKRHQRQFFNYLAEDSEGFWGNAENVDGVFHLDR